MDGGSRCFYMIGLLSREKDKDPRESRHSMVRYCEPLLDTFGVPHARLEGPNDVHLIPEYYRLSRERVAPPPSWSAWRRSDGDGHGHRHEAHEGPHETGGRAPGDRGRPRPRDLRAHHDDLSGLAHHRARRSLGGLRRLHGRRLLHGAGPGPRPSRPPGNRPRRGRLAPHAAGLARHERGRGAAQLRAPPVQERRVSHLRRAGHPGRARRGLRHDGEGRGLSGRHDDRRSRGVQAPAPRAAGCGRAGVR
jgi:hypothetical protein